MKDSQDLKGLYLHELMDICDAETQITKALPDMIEASKNPKLKEALTKHFEETKDQLRKVEELIASHGEEGKEKCAGMAGLLKEGEKSMKDFEEGPVRDAAMIAACQKVEHYEISAYGTLRVFATQLGLDDDAAILSEILEQEDNADKTLTKIAEGGVNKNASKESRAYAH